LYDESEDGNQSYPLLANATDVQEVYSRS
jgi:hypothetical protein